MGHGLRAGFIAILALSPFVVLAGDEQPANSADEAPVPETDAATEEAVEAAAEAAAATADAGGMPVDEPQVSSLAGFFDGLAADTVQAKVESLYDPAAVLEDPFGRHEGREDLIEHMKSMLDGMTVTVEVKEEFVSGEETVALWTATLTHKRLNSGESVYVEGVTHARFVGGKIAAQRDFYDLGGALYENVTVIGSLVKWVKAKITD